MEDKEHREAEEEQACKLCDDYQKTQGPSVLSPAWAGRHWARTPSRCVVWRKSKLGVGGSGETDMETENEKVDKYSRTEIIIDKRLKYQNMLLR